MICFCASDEFEVSIFLTETSTRHSLLYKHKHFRDTTQTKLTSNSTKLTGASREAPVDVDNDDNVEAREASPILREENDDDDVVALHDIPSFDQNETAGAGAPERTSKRRRRERDPAFSGHGTEISVISDNDEDFLSSSDDEEDEDADTSRRPAKRRKDDASMAQNETGRDDKKKLAMDISYEGFAIYGRVLCLVVKRRGDGAGAGKGKGLAITVGGGARSASRAGVAPAGQAMMENWITSTQMPDAAGE